MFKIILNILTKELAKFIFESNCHIISSCKCAFRWLLCCVTMTKLQSKNLIEILQRKENRVFYILLQILFLRKTFFFFSFFEVSEDAQCWYFGEENFCQEKWWKLPENDPFPFLPLLFWLLYTYSLFLVFPSLTLSFLSISNFLFYLFIYICLSSPLSLQ